MAKDVGIYTKRNDGRAFDEVREMSAEVGIVESVEVI